MNAQLQMALTKAKKEVELKEIHCPCYSNDVYAKLFRNAVDIVKYYIKDGMHDFARISEMEKRTEKDGVKLSGFVFTILYRETGTHISELSGKEEESSFLEAIFRTMGSSHIVVVEKTPAFGNDNYSYEFYKVKESKK